MALDAACAAAVHKRHNANVQLLRERIPVSLRHPVSLTSTGANVECLRYRGRIARGGCDVRLRLDRYGLYFAAHISRNIDLIRSRTSCEHVPSVQLAFKRDLAIRSCAMHFDLLQSEVNVAGVTYIERERSVFDRSVLDHSLGPAFLGCHEDRDTHLRQNLHLSARALGLFLRAGQLFEKDAIGFLGLLRRYRRSHANLSLLTRRQRQQRGEEDDIFGGLELYLSTGILLPCERTDLEPKGQITFVFQCQERAGGTREGDTYWSHLERTCGDVPGLEDQAENTDHKRFESSH